LKKFFISSIIGLGLVSSLVAEDCIMVKELNVEFKNDTVVYMDQEEKKKVLEFGKFLMDTGLYAVVEGHTSNFAPAEYNYELSKKRANKVRSELIGIGVKPKQIKAMAFGESSPLYDNNTEIGAQKNRRVIAEVFNNESDLNEYMKTESARVSKIKHIEQ